MSSSNNSSNSSEVRDPMGHVISISLDFVCEDHYGDPHHWPSEASARLLRALIPEEGFKKYPRLTNSSATLAALIKQIEQVETNLEANDLIIISFTGHGAQFKRFRDGSHQKQNPWEGWKLFDQVLFFNELWAIAKTLRLRNGELAEGVRVLIFSDACNSGGLGSSDSREKAVDAAPWKFYDRKRECYEPKVSACQIGQYEVKPELLAFLAVPEDSYISKTKPFTRFFYSIQRAIFKGRGYDQSYYQLYAKIMEKETRDQRGLKHPPILHYYSGHLAKGFPNQLIFKL